MKRKRYTLYNTVFASIFAALTVVLTYFLKLPIPNGGYVHFGDTIIFLCASLLPTPYAIVSACIGSGLSDLLGGYSIYVIPSVIIKSCIVLFFTQKGSTIICKKNKTALVFALLITALGYFVADTVIIYVSMSATQISPAILASVANIPWNALQALCSSVFYLIFATSLDRINFKSKLFGGKK